MKNVTARLPEVNAGRMKDARPQKNTTNVMRMSALTSEKGLSVTKETESLVEIEMTGAHLIMGEDGVEELLSDVVQETGTGTDSNLDILSVVGTKVIMVLMILKENSLQRSM
jgi:hypothetical protein